MSNMLWMLAIYIQMLLKEEHKENMLMIFDSPFSYCKEEYDKENLILSINYDVAAKKRKKDLLNNNTKIPCKHYFTLQTNTSNKKTSSYSKKRKHHVLFFIADFHRDKWIYVHKGSTKEVSPVKCWL